jgi:hypothetical protein
MAKVIQICASQNDLFALDDEGDIYRYDFKVKTWETLRAMNADAQRFGAMRTISSGSEPHAEETQ